MMEEERVERLVGVGRGLGVMFRTLAGSPKVGALGGQEKAVDVLGSSCGFPVVTRLGREAASSLNCSCCWRACS